MGISILVARCLLGEVTRRGFDVAPLLESSDVDPGRLQDMRGMLSFEKTGRLVEGAVALTNDPAIGLSAGALAPDHTLQMIGHLMLAQPTIRDAFKTLVRYGSLLADGTAWNLIERNDFAMWCCESVIPDGDTTRVLMDFAVAITANLGRHFLRAGERPRAVHFRHAAPSYATQYETTFRCPAFFSQERNAVVLSRTLLDRVKSYPDPALAQLLRDPTEQLLRERAQSRTFSNSIRAMLRHEPDLANVEMQRVATALKLSVHTLRRRLSAEGVCFATLLDDARGQLAREQLRREDTSIQQAAEKLGFSEPSAFYRAFKRWTGRPLRSSAGTRSRDVQAHATTPHASAETPITRVRFRSSATPRADRFAALAASCTSSATCKKPSDDPGVEVLVRSRASVKGCSWAAILAVLAAGCTEIRCPKGTVAEGEDCVCPGGLSFDEQAKTCPKVPSDQPDGGQGAAPTGASGGASTPMHEADAAAPMSFDDAGTPQRASDASTPDAAPGSGTGAVPSSPNAGMPTALPPPRVSPAAAEPAPSEDSCVDLDPSPNDDCVFGKRAKCHDPYVWTGHEDCEIGVGAATPLNCYECRRTRYHACARTEDCTDGRNIRADALFGDVCLNGVCTPLICPPGSEDWCIGAGRCPDIVGNFKPTVEGEQYCLIPCNFGQCPVGLICQLLQGSDVQTGAGSCVGPSHVALQ